CRSSVRRCCRRDLWSREGPAHKARGLTMSVFTFRPEPTGRPLLADEFWRSAIDQYHQRQAEMAAFQLNASLILFASVILLIAIACFLPRLRGKPRKALVGTVAAVYRMRDRMKAKAAAIAEEAREANARAAAEAEAPGRTPSFASSIAGADSPARPSPSA